MIFWAFAYYVMSPKEGSGRYLSISIIIPNLESQVYASFPIFSSIFAFEEPKIGACHSFVAELMQDFFAHSPIFCLLLWNKIENMTVNDHKA